MKITATNQNLASEASAETQVFRRDGPKRDAHWRKRYRGKWRSRWSRRLWGLIEKHPRLYGIAIVLYTLPSRSRFQCALWEAYLKGCPGPYRVVLGPAWEFSQTGQSVRCKRTHARIADIEKFSANFPQGTLLEDWTFLQGWEAGERFALGNSDIAKKDGGCQSGC
jgi:hypothetical protein